MNQWIIAPLLAADGTATHRPGSNNSKVDKDKQDEPTEEPTEERRHGDRRDNHEPEVDTDFARGEDRREDVP